MGASQCKVWYLNCGRQGHAVWLCDIEGAKPPLRVMVDGECVFSGDPSTVPEHGEILRQPLENSALVVSMEKTSKQPVYTLQWDGRAYEDDLSMLKNKKSTVDLSEVYKVRLKAMEVKMEDAPVKEGSSQMKSTAFFTIIANLYTTRSDSSGALKSPSSSGQIQVCSGVSSHRFSALLDVHDKIHAYYATSLPDAKMPKKPEKSMKGTSGVSTSDADFIGQRKMAIDKWLQGLVNLPRIVYVPDFVEFFGLPFIRPKYCGGHIVFTQPTSLDAPAHLAAEKSSDRAQTNRADPASAEVGHAEKTSGGNTKFEPSDSDDEEYVVQDNIEESKDDAGFKTVDDFDDFNNSPSKAGADIEVPEAYSVEGVQEVGLSMFGEEEEEEAANAGALSVVAEIDAEHARTSAAAKEKDVDAADSEPNAAPTNSEGDGSDPAPKPPPVELSPMEKLLQAESKLSLYQQRLEQAEESQNHGVVDKLYEEIAKLQRSIFLLKEEADKYEAAHAPTEAELWEEEDDGEVQIEEQQTVMMDGPSPMGNRRMTTGGDEWGDFAADGDDDWGDGGDGGGGEDPFGSVGNATLGAENDADDAPDQSEHNAGDDAFAEDDDWN